MGLVGLCLSLFILADALFGLVNDRRRTGPRPAHPHRRDHHGPAGRRLARTETWRAWGRIARHRARSQPRADSPSAVRHKDGELLLSSGAHAPAWAAREDRVLPRSRRSPCPSWQPRVSGGRVEFEFKPVAPPNWQAWLAERMTWVMIGLPLLLLPADCTSTCGAAWSTSNPLSVVPEPPARRARWPDRRRGAARRPRPRGAGQHGAARDGCDGCGQGPRAPAAAGPCTLSLPDHPEPPWLEVAARRRRHAARRARDHRRRRRPGASA